MAVGGVDIEGGRAHAVDASIVVLAPAVFAVSQTWADPVRAGFPDAEDVVFSSGIDGQLAGEAWGNAEFQAEQCKSVDCSTASEWESRIIISDSPIDGAPAVSHQRAQ